MEFSARKRDFCEIYRKTNFSKVYPCFFKWNFLTIRPVLYTFNLTCRKGIMAMKSFSCADRTGVCWVKAVFFEIARLYWESVKSVFSLVSKKKKFHPERDHFSSLWRIIENFFDISKFFLCTDSENMVLLFDTAI